MFTEHQAIDIQITGRELAPAIKNALNRAGYQWVSHITKNHRPGHSDGVDDWLKWFFKPSPAQRAVNVQLRLTGRSNQRYPLLFRDYLRNRTRYSTAEGRLAGASTAQQALRADAASMDADAGSD